VIVAAVVTQMITLATLTFLTGAETATLTTTTNAIPTTDNDNSITMLVHLGYCAILIFLCTIVIKEIPPLARGIASGVFSYQPTPHEVIPKEKAAGVRPSTASQRTTDQELGDIDRRLLLEEGLSTSSVPKLMPR
jgi:hypothetical protein